MSPLDASFLHVEDWVSHMHIASVGVFEGPLAPFADIVARVRAKLPLVPRYRQVVRSSSPSSSAGRSGWTTPTSTSTTTSATPPCRRRGAKAELRKLVGRVMSQPLDRDPAPVGDLGRRRPRRRQLGDALEDPPRHGRRRLRHRPAGGRSSTSLPRSPSAEPDAWEPSSGADVASLAGRGRRRPAPQPLRAVPRRPGRAPGSRARRCARPSMVTRGLSAMAGLVRPTPVSSLNGPIGPHRRYGWASTTVDDIKAVRKSLGGTFNDVVLAAITNGFRELLLSRGESVDRVVRTLVPVSVRPRDTRAAPSATAPSRTRSRPCSPSCPSASATPSSGSTRSPRRWRVSRSRGRPSPARRSPR